MSGPKRIQLSRKRGWRKPEGAIVVARPSKWGNPYRAGQLMYLTGKKKGQFAGVADVVQMYRNIATINTPAGDALRRMIRDQLAGHDLACWCPLDQPCHADVLLELANQ